MGLLCRDFFIAEIVTDDITEYSLHLTVLVAHVFVQLNSYFSFANITGAVLKAGVQK